MINKKKTKICLSEGLKFSQATKLELLAHLDFRMMNNITFVTSATANYGYVWMQCEGGKRAWSRERERSQVCNNGFCGDIHSNRPLLLVVNYDISWSIRSHLFYKSPCFESSHQSLFSLSLHCSAQQCSAYSIWYSSFP